VTDDELRDLQERVALIEEMAAQHGWTLLVDRAHATLAAYQQRLLGGAIKDYSDYEKTVAFIDGAFFVLHLPSTVRSELDDEMTYREEIAEAEEEEAA